MNIGPLNWDVTLGAKRDLAGLRKWRVKNFDHHLIFYMPRQDGVAIVRVLHAAQDWSSLMGIDD